MSKLLLFIFLSSIPFFVFAQEDQSVTTIESIDAETHIVAQGETLFSISKMYQVSIYKIKEYNDLEDNSIFVNQILFLKPRIEEEYLIINEVSPNINHLLIENNEALDTITNTSNNAIAITNVSITPEEIDSITIAVPELPRAIWIDDYYEAKKLAKEEGKILLIFFTGSDWCGICRMLKTNFFESPEFVEIANTDLVLYEADFPRRTNYLSKEKEDTNWKIKAKYRAHDGFPTVILIAPDGQELGRRFNFGIDGDTDFHFELVNNAVQQNKK